MKVCDAMSRHVQTVRPDDSITVAMEAMLRGGFSGAPVVDATGALVGMITEGDLLHRAENGTERRRSPWLAFLLGPGRVAQEYVASHGRTVREVMTPEVVAVNAAAPLSDAVALMEKHRIKRLPVLQQGQLVGMLSRADLMRSFLRAQPTVALSDMEADAVIEQRIGRALALQVWAPLATTHIAVRHGVAELDGVVTDDAVRAALYVLVENVPGVHAVKDRLTTIEPMSGCIAHGAPDDKEPLA